MCFFHYLDHWTLFYVSFFCLCISFFVYGLPNTCDTSFPECLRFMYSLRAPPGGYSRSIYPSL